MSCRVSVWYLVGGLSRVWQGFCFVSRTVSIWYLKVSVLSHVISICYGDSVCLSVTYKFFFLHCSALLPTLSAYKVPIIDEIDI